MARRSSPGSPGLGEQRGGRQGGNLEGRVAGEKSSNASFEMACGAEMEGAPCLGPARLHVFEDESEALFPLSGATLAANPQGRMGDPRGGHSPGRNGLVLPQTLLRSFCWSSWFGAE